jgi:hypothetical protein
MVGSPHHAMHRIFRQDPGLLARVLPRTGISFPEYTSIDLLDGPARDLWRQLVATCAPNFPGSDTIVEEAWLAGRAKGEAKGRAEDILHSPGTRGIEISDAVRDRVMDCADLDALGAWLGRSLGVASAEELFAEEQDPRRAPRGTPRGALRRRKPRNDYSFSIT